jgi:CheY-like chemotaxis protein
MVLRVLIIEDTPERQEVLRSLYRNHAWILVETGQRAVTLLNAYDFDLVSLDYNLRGPLTGADVARALLASRNRQATLVVHSLNPKGVQQILEVAPQARIYPVSKIARTNQALKDLRSRLDELGTAFDWSRPRRDALRQGVSLVKSFQDAPKADGSSP